MNKVLIGVGILFLVIGGLQQGYQNPKESTTKCSGKAIPALTEGPYYKQGAPGRRDIRDGAPGTKMTLTGSVLNTDCKPIPNAWLDFWQADGEGNYDNSAYTLRGSQRTDSSGKYTLTTVVPGEYPGRTPHIHVKVRAASNNPIITTQLFLPNQNQNASDSIFDKTLVMDVQDSTDGKLATYNFIIED